MAFFNQSKKGVMFTPRKSPPPIVWAVVLLLGFVLAYFIWPYLVAFLAILGGLQILRAWQRSGSNRNSRK